MAKSVKPTVSLDWVILTISAYGSCKVGNWYVLAALPSWLMMVDCLTVLGRTACAGPSIVLFYNDSCGWLS